jgi:hypothetical protein
MGSIEHGWFSREPFGRLSREDAAALRIDARAVASYLAGESEEDSRFDSTD